MINSNMNMSLYAKMQTLYTVPKLPFPNFVLSLKSWVARRSSLYKNGWGLTSNSANSAPGFRMAYYCKRNTNMHMHIYPQLLWRVTSTWIMIEVESMKESLAIIIQNRWSLLCRYSTSRLRNLRFACILNITPKTIARTRKTAPLTVPIMIARRWEFFAALVTTARD
jgi:hypothetical protein